MSVTKEENALKTSYEERAGNNDAESGNTPEDASARQIHGFRVGSRFFVHPRCVAANVCFAGLSGFSLSWLSFRACLHTLWMEQL